jgi:DNA-binding response OmpR family regulator
MFLATSDFLPINAVIRLEIDLPQDGGRLAVTCRVAYVRDAVRSAASGKPAGMGVQFLDLDRGGLDRLAQFVAERSMTFEEEKEPERTRQLDLLVVDTDAEAAERVARAFRLRADRVRTTHDGLQALGECLKRPPDAVISEVELPRMDGWNLVRILRSRPSLSSVPVLFLTSLSSPEERLRAYKLGVDDFVPKPSDVDELVARTDRAVDRAHRPGATLMQRKTLRGDLEQISLGSVLSFLELEKKTGVLLLVGEHTARVFVEAGRPLKIELDGSKGTQDQRQLMSQVLEWNGGQFEFGAQDVACEDELRSSVTSILLEHARQRDEGGR